MQKLFIVGNLTGDPQTRVTQTGKTVCTFTVAVNRRHKKDETDFFRVSVWDKLGELCQKYLAKGRKVAVTGSVSATAYQAQDGTARASLNVMADEVEFLSPKEDGNKGFEEVSVDDFPWGE